MGELITTRDSSYGSLVRTGDAGKIVSGKDGERYGFLCFTLGDEEYGVDLHLINQIVKPPPVTWVPNAESYVLGVVSIRGAVVTLVDLRRVMGRGETEWLKNNRVLIVNRGDEQVGLLVDSVTQVRRLHVRDLEADVTIDEGLYHDHVLFIARPETEAEKLLVIIDLHSILAEKMI